MNAWPLRIWAERKGSSLSFWICIKCRQHTLSHTHSLALDFYRDGAKWKRKMEMKMKMKEWKANKRMNNAFNILSLYFCCFLLSTTGWSSAPDEKATKYRLTIKDIQQQESGTYTCASPRGLTNSIVIIVASNLYAPNSFSPFRMFGVVVNGTPRTTVRFSIWNERMRAHLEYCFSLWMLAIRPNDLKF